MKISKKMLMMREKARRSHRIRKLKSTAKTKGLKASSVKSNIFEKKSEIFLNYLIHKQDPIGYCKHHLIGASNFLTFLQGRYTFDTAHSVLQTTYHAKVVGSAGEIAFNKKYSGYVLKIHPFGICRTNPWVSASSDFLVRIPSVRAIEIKTFQSALDCQRFYDNFPMRNIIQVWLQLETLKVSRGSVYIYRLDQTSKIIFLWGVINCNRKASLFNSDINILSCIRFSGFLKEYLENHNIFPSQDYFNRLSLRLVSRCNSTEPFKVENKKKEYPNVEERNFEFECDYWKRKKEDYKGKKTEYKELESIYKNFTTDTTDFQSRNFDFDEDIRTEIFSRIWFSMSSEDKKVFENLKEEMNCISNQVKFLSKSEELKVKKSSEKGREDRNKVLGSMALSYKKKYLEEKEKNVNNKKKIEKLTRRNKELEKLLEIIKKDHKKKNKSKETNETKKITKRKVKIAQKKSSERIKNRLKPKKGT